MVLTSSQIDEIFMILPLISQLLHRVKVALNPSKVSFQNSDRKIIFESIEKVFKKLEDAEIIISECPGVNLSQSQQRLKLDELQEVLLHKKKLIKCFSSVNE